MTTSWQPDRLDPRTPARSRSGQLLGQELPHGIYYRTDSDGVLEGIAVIDGHVVSRWHELPFPLQVPLQVPLCSPWNRILADSAAIGLTVDQALACVAADPEHLHPDDGARAIWAAEAVLAEQVAYAEVSPRSWQMSPLVAAIESSPLILTYHSERWPHTWAPTLRVGRSERIGDLWDIPALIRAWEEIDIPDDVSRDVSRRECKALDEASDMRVSDVVRRPDHLRKASWSVMALLIGADQGWAAWESWQEWRLERYNSATAPPDAPC
ncbi:hypothetical protein [Nonomuraea sp. NPDC049784]|uniref:hypothetical protein n=1 Tax=Nonomuraea sp. NPDC049784 TaxID=3154361 RepID=UPI0034112388